MANSMLLDCQSKNVYHKLDKSHVKVFQHPGIINSNNKTSILTMEEIVGFMDKLDDSEEILCTGTLKDKLCKVMMATLTGRRNGRC